jgi:tetratricopeptide (TPR) repeat protein
MTEREKYRTLGVYYGAIVRNYDKAIENYQALVSNYPSDHAGHNNLAVAYFNTLDFKKATEEGRRALEIQPKHLRYRSNYALYAMYASDFPTAVAEARKAVTDNPASFNAYLPIAVDAIINGRFDEAEAAYAAMARAGAQGASRSAIGRADLLMYRHQFGDAIRILEAGMAADEKIGNRAALAAKRVALAEARQALGEASSSVAAAKAALELAQLEYVAYPAGGVLFRGAREADARAVAASLAKELSPRSRAYGRLLEGEMSLSRAQFVDAVQAFGAARDLANVWLTRFDLGRAYVEAGRYAEAISELELCERRRGEAAAMFLDDVPTLRYLAPLPYWLARAQQGLGIAPAARENYKKFIDLAPDDARDPLIADARRRIASN